MNKKSKSNLNDEIFEHVKCDNEEVRILEKSDDKEKAVLEKSVKNSEGFNQFEIIQEEEPLYASGDENLDVTEITNHITKKNSFSINEKNRKCEEHQPIKKEKIQKKTDLPEDSTSLHGAAIVGFFFLGYLPGCQWFVFY